jgi:radical SAM protein with 4Fe4S-binding SPASM domain
MTPAIYDILARECGSVAVSAYDLGQTISTVTELFSRDIQTNIHIILSSYSTTSSRLLINTLATSSFMLENLNALTILMYKPKGRQGLTGVHNISVFNDIVKLAEDNKIPLGFDSCAAPLYLRYLANKHADGKINDEDLKKTLATVEPCEAGLFSLYISVNGDVYPCSFTESSTYFRPDLNLTHDNISMKDVWDSTMLAGWREDLLGSKCNSIVPELCSMHEHCRRCPAYTIYPSPCS